ncbi:MAG: hypothetical protein ACTTH7_00405 [Treponema sp.]
MEHAKKQKGKKQPKQILLNGMAIEGCVCNGEMFIGQEAWSFIEKIPLLI